MNIMQVFYIIIGGLVLFIAFGIYKVVTLLKASSSAVARSYHESDGSLHLKKRGPFWKDFVKVKKAENVFLGYEPEKLHYGSVTTGGVTSGGFYKTGGYNKFVTTTVPDKYTMKYIGRDINGETIRSIVLSEELYKEARNSSIAKYLTPSSNCIVLIGKTHLSQEQANSFVENAVNLATNTPITSNVYVADKSGYPSREKCMEILNWMCGK